MFASLSLPLLILIFVAGAVVVWFAGVQLSRTTDIMDDRFHLGQALGGLIFLSIATNLPELAIVGSASLTHQVGIAIGNILGGIAIQTVVLVILDGFGLRGKDTLTNKAASLTLVLEGVVLISVLVVSIMGTQLPKSAILFSRLAPGDLLIVAWGSTHGSITAAVKSQRALGRRIGHVHLRHLNPLPANLAQVFKRYKKILVPELNMGQLLWLLRAKYLIDAIGLNKIQGRPFKQSELEQKIEDVLGV